MPIPQLSYKTKSPQSWRHNKIKKYYLGGRSRFRLARWKTKNNSMPSFSSQKGHKLITSLSKKAIKYFVLLSIITAFFVFIAFVWLARGLPDPNRLIERQIAQSTKIYDRTGKTILYEIHGNEKRTLVSLDEIPDYLKNATIAIEDKDFYKHGGFSLWAMFRTAITNILFNKKAGGSTLTQQFIKNAVLTTEKTYTRKIKELILAYRVEKRFSKDEILQMYLNEIPYGSTAYGVEAACQKYFGKSARDITLAEAAILAALPQAPSRYSPYGQNRDLLLSRQKYILDLMVKQNYITNEEAETAKNTKVTFKEQSNNIIAPHFVMYVKEKLAEKYGEKMIEQEGLKIYTTLDLYKQKIAEEVIKEKAPDNNDKYQASNAALVSLDPKTGQILAMVGSRDYFNNEIDGQVNVALQPRQPGSSFKPIVYTASFIKGYTPNTILYDVVTNFSTDQAKPYEPHNYDDKEHGPVTIKNALAGSLNIPAVKAIYLTGIDNVLNLAHDLGYTTLNEKGRFGLSLVLGGGEVKLIEHTAAYGIFAREGLFHPTTIILKIENKDGKIIEEFDNKEEKIIDAKFVRQINDILSDNSARAYIFGENNYLTLENRPVAAKTGTTNDYRDAWTIGYTPSLVTGVWVGNNNNASMKRGADGSVVAAPIWHDYMKKVLGDTPVEYFNPAEPIKTGKPVLDGEIEGKTTVKIDKFSGLLATQYTPPSFVLEKTFTQVHCILYYLDKDNPLGAAPTDPKIDPQFELWENRVLAWAEREKIATSAPPTAFDNVHLPENAPSFTIEYPTNNQSIMEPLLTTNIKASAPRGINRAEYYLNDNLLAIISSFPFNLNKQINFLNNGFYGLKVRVCDDVDNCSEQKIEFNLILDEKKTNEKIGLSWKQPISEVTLINSDFPFTLKIGLINWEQITKIKFYLRTPAGEMNNIAVVELLKNNLVEVEWSDIPNSGPYFLFAEANNWNGQTIKSEEMKVIIRNEQINN